MDARLGHRIRPERRVPAIPQLVVSRACCPLGFVANFGLSSQSLERQASCQTRELVGHRFELFDKRPGLVELTSRGKIFKIRGCCTG